MTSRPFTAGILFEAALVAVAAAVFAFGVNSAVNKFSPSHGLNLTLNYFPTDKLTPAPAKVSPPAPVQPGATKEDAEEAATAQRIKDDGLQPFNRAQTERLFHDPRYLQGLVVFVDARSPREYAEGHIPGAYPLDYYHRDKDLADDINPCMSADQVVVYCTSGECELAENTAKLLQETGVPLEKLFVYGGGYEDWSGHHLPLEQGARNSGLAPVESK